MTIFPASDKVTDLFNLIKVNVEIAFLEDAILNARLNGFREIIVNTSSFTLPANGFNEASLPSTIIGTSIFQFGPFSAEFSDEFASEEQVTDPGKTWIYGDATTVILAVIVNGTVDVADGAPIIITSSGSLHLGTAATVALTLGMTLESVVSAINTETVNTGIVASIDGSFHIRLLKNNLTDSPGLIIRSTSTPSILTDLGLISNDSGYLLVASMLPFQTTIIPTNMSGITTLSISNAAGVFICNGTANEDLGFVPTMDPDGDSFCIVDHGFVTSQQVTIDGVAPLLFKSYPNWYYVNRLDDDKFQLSTVLFDALVNIVDDVTSYGTGIFSVREIADSEIYYNVENDNITNVGWKDRIDTVQTYFEELEYTIELTNVTNTMQWNIRW